MFSRIGVMREICMGERRWVVRDRKGYRYLELLLARPHHAVLATTLKADVDGCDPRVYAGSHGPIMTATSLDELRTRATELREDLSEARRSGDVHCEERILTEMLSIAASVRGATNHRGAPRQHRDHDRVRIAVTNAIRRALWSIAQVAPEVATYFSATITTGTWLIYRPIADERWEMQHAA